MALRQIRFQGDDILRKKAKEVKEITPKILELLDDMKQTLVAKEAVGLAATQVGMLRRIAIVDYDGEYYELINPEVIETEGTQVSEEACLSVDGLCGDVTRPQKMVVRAIDRTGQEFFVTAEDFLATIFSHEIDHLDGIMFTDKAENIRPMDDEEMKERKARRRARRARRMEQA